MARITTSVSGEVIEYHYRCDGEVQHEVSLLTREDVKDVANCMVLGCVASARLHGQNPAEVSKNPTELLTN